MTEYATVTECSRKNFGLRGLGKLEGSAIQSKFDSFKRFVGVKTRSRAFTGPLEVGIELIYGCNLKCPFCYCFSPLVKRVDESVRVGESVREKTPLDYGLFKKIVYELSGLGVKKITFCPAGEPFLHPDLLDMVEYVKGKGLDCTIYTNGTLVDEETAERLSRLKVEIRFSLHAGDYKSWSKLQPKKVHFDFNRLKKVLKILNSENSKASVHLFGVITSINYKDIGKLFNLAKETNTKTVFVDPPMNFEGAEKIGLNREQSNFLKLKLVELQGFAEAEGIENNIEDMLSNTVYSNDGVFEFAPENIYDNNTPCSVGWFFSRIDVEGNVFPCFTSKSVGNVKQESFKDIWYSQAYNKARREMACIHKSSELREKYFCDKCCFARWSQNIAKRYSLSNIFKRIFSGVKL